MVSETRRKRRRFSRSKSFTLLRSRSQSPTTLPPSDSFRCIGVMHESMLFDMYDQMYNAPIDQRPSLTLYEMWFRSLKHYNVAITQSQDSVLQDGQCMDSTTSDASSTLYKCTPNNSPHTPVKTIPQSASSSLHSESLVRPSMREIVVDNEILMVEIMR